jgi:hypothetical protein
LSVIDAVTIVALTDSTRKKAIARRTVSPTCLKML